MRYCSNDHTRRTETNTHTHTHTYTPVQYAYSQCSCIHLTTRHAYRIYQISFCLSVYSGLRLTAWSSATIISREQIERDREKGGETDWQACGWNETISPSRHHLRHMTSRVIFDIIFATFLIIGLVTRSRRPHMQVMLTGNRAIVITLGCSGRVFSPYLRQKLTDPNQTWQKENTSKIWPRIACVAPPRGEDARFCLFMCR